MIIRNRRDTFLISSNYYWGINYLFWGSGKISPKEKQDKVLILCTLRDLKPLIISPGLGLWNAREVGEVMFIFLCKAELYFILYFSRQKRFWLGQYFVLVL